MPSATTTRDHERDDCDVAATCALERVTTVSACVRTPRASPIRRLPAGKRTHRGRADARTGHACERGFLRVTRRAVRSRSTSSSGAPPARAAPAASTPTRRTRGWRCGSAIDDVRRRWARASGSGCSTARPRGAGDGVRHALAGAEPRARPRTAARRSWRRAAGRPAAAPDPAARSAAQAGRALDAKRRQSPAEAGRAARHRPRTTESAKLHRCTCCHQILWFALGIGLMVLVFDSAHPHLRAPARRRRRSSTRVVFIGLRWVFNRIARARAAPTTGAIGDGALRADRTARRCRSCGSRDDPCAFTAMFHALGVRGFERAFEMSGSSLFTLGLRRGRPTSPPTSWRSSRRRSASPSSAC